MTKVIRLRNGNRIVEIPVENNQEAIEIATSFFETEVTSVKALSTGVMPIKDTNNKEQEELVSKIPSISQIADFIRNQPNYEHDAFAIHDEFFGRPISSDPENKIDRRIYARIYRRINEARDIIAEKEGGEWKEKTEYPINAPKRKVYTFSKSDLGGKLEMRRKE